MHFALHALAAAGWLAAAAQELEPPANAAAPDAIKSVEVVEQTEHYEVRGETARDLANHMSASGPRASRRHAWALTTWEVRTTYALTPVRDGCVVTNPRATIRIVTTLPRWKTTRPPPLQLRASWRRMFASMVEHEGVHRDHGFSAARNAVSGLQNMPVQPDCRRAERLASLILRREVAHATKLSKAFDRETRFGADAGVHLGI